MIRQLAVAFGIGCFAWCSLTSPTLAQQPFQFKSKPEDLGLKSEEPPTPAKRSPWREFVSEEGRFRVEFPGKPIPSEAEIVTPVGPAKLHLQSVPAIKVVFGAHYLDYPQSTKKLSTQKLIDAARDEAKAGLGGTIVEENALPRNDVEGREILFDVPTLQAMCRVQFFVKGGRLYQVTATGPRDSVTSNFAQRFFSSWKPIESK